MFSYALLHLTVKQLFKVKIITPFFPGTEVVVPKSEVTFPKQYKANHTMRLDFKHWSGWPQIQPSIKPTRWMLDNYASDLRPIPGELPSGSVFSSEMDFIKTIFAPLPLSPPNPILVLPTCCLLTSSSFQSILYLKPISYDCLLHLHFSTSMAHMQEFLAIVCHF